MDQTVNELQQFACQIRIETIRALSVMGVGHIGGSMSMADLMAVLYGKVLNVDPHFPRKEDRDWVVVSKGHCGPALYVTLALKSWPPLTGPALVCPAIVTETGLPAWILPPAPWARGCPPPLVWPWGTG